MNKLINKFYLFLVKNQILITLIIILLIIYFINNYLKNNYEYFENSNNIKIKTFIITDPKNKIRKKIINEEMPKLKNLNPIIYNFVNGKKLSNNYVKKINKRVYKIIKSNLKNTEIGCYLSHLNIIKKIMNEEDKNGYTIVFEDDLKINVKNFEKYVNYALKKYEDFDLFYLGTTTNKQSIGDGENLGKNIYKAKGITLGTHAYIVKNSNAPKIYNIIKNIERHIDQEYSIKIVNGKLNAYVFSPGIVDQRSVSYGNKKPSIPTTI